MTRLSSLKVLVAEDESILREVVREELEFFGAKVEEASNGQEALELFKTRNFDVIISDLRMPGGDGLDLLKAIRSENSKLPFLMLVTGFSDVLIDKAYTYGVNAFFSKPFKLEALVESLRALTHSSDPNWTRKFQRLTLEFQANVQFINKDSPIEAQVFNIGQGGMFLKLDKDFPNPNTELKFKLKAPKNESLILEGAGVIRWVRENPEQQGPAGVGIEYTHLDKPSLINLLKIINESKPMPLENRS